MTIDTEMEGAHTESQSTLRQLRRFQGARLPENIGGSIPGMYYRDHNGWVKFSHGLETEQGKRMVLAKGWEPLEQYDPVDFSVEHDAKFHSLFRQGGAKEFPVEQIQEYGWHRRPPQFLVCGGLNPRVHRRHRANCWETATFPQMEGVETPEYRCDLCPASRMPLLSEEALRGHTEVMHNDHLVNRELVTGLRDALAPAIVNSSGVDEERLIEIVATTVTAVMKQTQGEGPSAKKPPVQREGGKDGKR